MHCSEIAASINGMFPFVLQNPEMHGWIPPRLRSVLGPDLTSVDADALEGLIGMGEDTDLEFKQQPWESTEGGSKECALDIADKANAGGGLIILGAVEDSEGSLDELRSVSASPEMALRIDQIVAARISPPPRVNHQFVDTPDGNVHLLSIEPTLRTPHAVSVGGHALRYPVRTGRTRRFLAEPEIADWYQRRHRAVAQSSERLTAQVQLASARVPAIAEDDEDWSWLVIVASPEFPGNLSLRRGLKESYEEWFDTARSDFPGFRWSGGTYLSPGFQALQVSDDYRPSVQFQSIGGDLGMDGSGGLLAGQVDRRRNADRGGTAMVCDEFLLADVINLAGVLARHAQYTGAVGDLTVACRLVSRQPMVLGYYRGFMASQLGQTREIESTATSIHTAPIEGLVEPGPARLALARLLVGDLSSAFGHPEPLQVDRDGALVIDQFYRDHQARVAAWAESAGVPTVASLAG